MQDTPLSYFGRHILHAAILVAAAGIASSAAGLEPDEAAFCDRAPRDELCHRLPHDIPQFFSSFVYRFMTEGAQDPFDIFSWRSFIALNWPVDRAGRAMDQPIGTAPDRPRRWQMYRSSKTVLGAVAAQGICGATDGEGPPYPLMTSQFRQAAGGVLIDAGLNFVVYDTRLNEWAARQVADSRAGNATATPVQFPDGYYKDRSRRLGGAPGSIVLKTAWRVLDQDLTDDNARYLTVPGRVAVQPMAVPTAMT